LSTELTAEDRRNGWTLESLRAYQREREKAFPVVAGNVVTEFKRPKAPVRIEGAGMTYNPLTRSFG
jgi:hypothetical protein